MSGAEKICKWTYRPGTNGSHFAKASCDGGFKYLSRIADTVQKEGCADYYNGMVCPSCGKQIQMDYALLS